MDVTIRNATLEDLPELLEMEQGLIADERPYDPTIRQEPVRYYDLPGMLEDINTKFLVADDGSQILSCGYAFRREPRHYLDHDAYAYFGFMYTLPAYRGRGFNGRIIDGLKEWAAQMGLFEVRLTVYTDNTPAIRAYRKAGFNSHLEEMRLRLERF